MKVLPVVSLEGSRSDSKGNFEVDGAPPQINNSNKSISTTTLSCSETSEAIQIDIYR